MARPPTRLIVGIDEAGYGPTLGPLVVASAALHEPVAGSAKDDSQCWEALDAWSALAPVVTRRRSADDGLAIPIADSKTLKLSNGTRRLHPLTYLERGVLCWLAHEHGEVPPTVQALLNRLGSRPGAVGRRCPWYADTEETLPLAHTADQLSLMRTRLGAVACAGGMEPCGLRAVVVDEALFNRGVRTLGSKARVSFRAVGALLRRVWRSAACEAEHPPLIIIDRQGGRTRYEAALRAVLAPARVEIIGECAERADYLARDRCRTLRIGFRVQAEEACMATAMASMTAKYVRELLMGRFNRYWSERIAELKPTAGYAKDARRWLGDASPHLTERDVTRLVRVR